MGKVLEEGTNYYYYYYSLFAKKGRILFATKDDFDRILREHMELKQELAYLKENATFIKKRRSKFEMNREARDSAMNLSCDDSDDSFMFVTRSNSPLADS